ncbi:MAG: hypothetical protein ACHP9Y_06445 [Gammaproteobacteria bacterium]
MQISIFLAKFLAIYFFIISLPMIFRPDAFRLRAQAYMNNDAVMLLGALLALLLGIFLILLHSIWIYDWYLAITLLAWLTFIKGVIHVLCPELAQHMMQRMNSTLAYRTSGIICLLLAIFLGYHGFRFGF